MTAAMSVLALFCVLIGLFFVPFLDQLIRPATNVLLEGANYVNLILGG
jgi:formate hydrogenlyase subunit 3/multisubunit Na+/H+ antiporter MnhD subunit